ncbi:ribonuclease HI family protein [Pseudoduganella chitinolytica]|uniref:Ribonuclease HI family protein n=1 Tax=Pseudoduganella chitinolytica TaxID=34070 RepID=A0ABY8BJZ0_9BURK|nr:ribonuclease HI family protein [Pseudoduganella chitinolytica]WEF35002.1 ribonuclease HI family protein [Pseudoduganella chitinolytica]
MPAAEPAVLSRKAALQALAAAARLARRAVPPAPGQWQAWFDGSATPNPGRIGVGALLLGPGGERVEVSLRAGEGSSADAEYLALIALLEEAAARSLAQLVVYGDSQVVVHDMLLPAGAGAASLAHHRAVAQALLARIGCVALRWVPRHRNGAADALSQQALAS